MSKAETTDGFMSIQVFMAICFALTVSYGFGLTWAWPGVVGLIAIGSWIGWGFANGE